MLCISKELYCDVCHQNTARANWEQLLQSSCTSSDDNTAVPRLTEFTHGISHVCFVFILTPSIPLMLNKMLTNNSKNSMLMLYCVMIIKIHIKNIFIKRKQQILHLLHFICDKEIWFAFSYIYLCFDSYFVYFNWIKYFNFGFPIMISAEITHQLIIETSWPEIGVSIMERSNTPGQLWETYGVVICILLTFMDWFPIDFGSCVTFNLTTNTY